MALSASAVDVALPELGRCVRVHNAPEVLDELARAMPGWPMTRHPAAGASPDLYLYRDADGLWQSEPGTTREFALPSPASAACSLVAELLGARLEQDAGLLGLHCGSVKINGRLALFPQSSKAGKSTLSVAFAAAGYRVFGDDVLGLTADGKGVGLGVAPRLRLPLPEVFAAEFVDYARRHAGPEDDRYRFVLPHADGLARAGETCPVGALVLLERSADSCVTPDVVALSPGEGLLQLLCQNFAHAASFQQPQALMARLLPLMQRVPCVLLRYGEPLAGARHLAQVLERGEGLGASAQTEADGRAFEHTGRDPSTPGAGEPDEAAPPLMPAGALWQPEPRVNVYPLGDELFLIHTPSGVIHRLNPTARLVWLLLQQEPLGVDELGAILAEHFQHEHFQHEHVQQSPEVITADVSGLVDALHRAGLVAPAPSGAAS